MLVNRRTYQTKRGEAAKVAAVLKSTYGQYPFDHPIRIYTSETGRLDTVALEIEYESLAQYEQALPAWVATVPAEQREQWMQLTEGELTSEFWQLVE